MAKLTGKTAIVTGGGSGIGRACTLRLSQERQHSREKFNNEPTAEAALQDRIEKLERLVGKLTLENEFLKKGLQNSLSQSGRNGKSSRYGGVSESASGEGVNS